MPVHDWTRVEAGDFHDFHQVWVVEIRNALNRGLLPPGFFAMTDQITGRPIPDVVTLQSRRQLRGGGTATLATPPSARLMKKVECINYSRRANRVLIRHGRGKVVAIIEILSPGNKESRNAISSFLQKAQDVLNQGINLLVVDLFPPTPRDPRGIFNAIMEEFGEKPAEVPPGQPLTVASFIGGEYVAAFADWVGLGEPLPSTPLFLSDDENDYIPAPLESTYMETWEVYPAELRELIEGEPVSNDAPEA